MNLFESDFSYVIILVIALFMYFSILHILRDPNSREEEYFKSKDVK